MSTDHRLDIYDVDLHLVTTVAQVRGLRRRYPGLHDGLNGQAMGQTTGWTDGANRLHVAIFINLADLVADGDPARMVTTVAHEATHVAGAICDGKGVEEEGWLEHYAYLVGWLSGWLWKETLR